jgi:glycosyltransferase involved in cell wall biosynthesis
MASTPRCSAVIPTINRSTLSRTVESILNQELPPDDYEVIVVNDTGVPLPAFAWQSSPQVHIITTNRVERCFARNAGATTARGEFLLFIDDDDYLLPNGLPALLQAAESSECDLISGGVNITDEHGVIERFYIPYCPHNMFAQFVMGHVLQLSHTLVRRSAFLRVGGFDPMFLQSQDRDFESRVSLTGTARAVQTIVAVVRRSGAPGSTTNFNLGVTPIRPFAKCT